MNNRKRGRESRFDVKVNTEPWKKRFEMMDGIGNVSSTQDLMADKLKPYADTLKMAKTRLEQEAKNAAIEEASSEFESVFLSLMLKEMRNTLDSEEGGLFGGDGSDTYGGMFDMFMGQHLSEASPLGIGDAIKEHLVELSNISELPSAVDFAKTAAAEAYQHNQDVVGE